MEISKEEKTNIIFGKISKPAIEMETIKQVANEVVDKFNKGQSFFMQKGTDIDAMNMVLKELKDMGKSVGVEVVGGGVLLYEKD